MLSLISNNSSCCSIVTITISITKKRISKKDKYVVKKTIMQCTSKYAKCLSSTKHY